MKDIYYEREDVNKDGTGSRHSTFVDLKRYWSATQLFTFFSFFIVFYIEATKMSIIKIFFAKFFIKSNIRIRRDCNTTYGNICGSATLLFL